MDQIVKVYAHKRHLIICSDEDAKNKDWVPIGEGKLGCVLLRTNRHLGISQEAIDLLKELKPGPDSIGDVDWFKSNEDGYCFSWLGGTKMMIDIKHVVPSRDYEVPNEAHYTLIDNTPPEEPVSIIDSSEGGD